MRRLDMFAPRQVGDRVRQLQYPVTWCEAYALADKFNWLITARIKLSPVSSSLRIKKYERGDYHLAIQTHTRNLFPTELEPLSMSLFRSIALF